MSEFEGQTVFITGAGSGFGKLLAESMAKKGAKLFLTDINAGQLKETAKQFGEQAKFMQSDVANLESNINAVDCCVDAWGGLDIAVNNAGIATPPKSFVEITEEEYDAVQNINAKGVFFGMQAQIKHMLNQKGGRILNVSSMAGLGGAPKLSAYSGSKHAVVGYTKTAAIEYAQKNIRVNAVCPFFTPTPLLEGLDDQALELLARGAPMKRLAEAEEIVAVMEGILLPGNSYMTGQCIAVDGGVSAY